MSDAETAHAETTTAEGHDGHDQGHAASEPLGPVDVTTWARALAGAVLGAVMVLAMFVARGG